MTRYSSSQDHIDGDWAGVIDVLPRMGSQNRLRSVEPGWTDASLAIWNPDLDILLRANSLPSVDNLPSSDDNPNIHGLPDMNFMPPVGNDSLPSTMSGMHEGAARTSSFNRIVPATDDDFLFVHRTDSTNDHNNVLNKDSHGLSYDMDTAKAEHGGFVDVVECVGSSPGTLVESVQQRPGPVLVRQSTGLADGPDVLICTLCGRGVAFSTWTMLSRHWRSRSHDGYLPTTEQRNDARQLFEHSLGSVFEHAAEWDPPHTPLPPIVGMEIVDAYRCGVADCPIRFVPAGPVYRRRPGTASWREHHRQYHGNSEFGNVGRPPVATALVARAEQGYPDEHGVDGPWGSLRRVQRLFCGRPYHEVDESPTAVTVVATADDAAGTFDRLFTDLERHKAREDQAQAAVVPAPANFHADAWARVVDFATHLQGFEWNKAKQVADAPGQDTTALQRWVHKEAKKTILKCYQSTVDAGQWLRQALMQRTEGVVGGKQMWEGYQSHNAVQGHIRPLLACVNYWSATHLDPVAQASVPVYVRDAAAERAWDALLEHGTRDLHNDDDGENDDGDKDALTPSQSLILELIMALLAQQANVEERRELPLIGALLVQGIVPGRQPAFRQAGEFSRTLASFSKMARSVVGKHLLDANMANHRDATPVVEARLVRGPNNAMNWIGHMLNTAMKMDREKPNKLQLTWLSNKETFLLGPHVVSRNDLVAIVHGAIEQARQVLCRELLFVEALEEIPPVPWEHMIDRPGDTTPRYSCWTDTANKVLLGQGEGWLMRRVRDTQADRFVNHQRRSWSNTAKVVFEASLQRFRDAMLPLFTWAIGPSIRGQTVASYQWRNTVQNPRNLMVNRGRLMLVGGWHKNLHRGTSAALHVLPREVADLCGWYLWLVCPFWDTLRRQQGGADIDDNDPSGTKAALLFPGHGGEETLGSSYITGCLLKASQRVVQPGFGLQPGRQLISGFVRKFIPAEALSGGDAYFFDHHERNPRNEAERAAALVAHGRARATEQAGEEEDCHDIHNDNDDDDLPMIDTDGDMWQPAPLERNSLHRFDALRDKFASRSVVAHATGHAITMDRLRYANDVDAIPGADDLAVMLWSLVSHHWQLVLRLPSAIQCEEERQFHHTLRKEQRPVKRKVERDRKQKQEQEQEAPSEYSDDTNSQNNSSDDHLALQRKSRRGRVRRGGKRARQDSISRACIGRSSQDVPSRTHCRRLLREFVQDDTADFRGLQWSALECILGNSGSSVLVVAPTSFGKTALLALPAMLPCAGVTVVVVPLCSLREQLMDRCARAFIRCEQWRGDGDTHMGLFNQASLVIVMPEHLEMHSFSAWLNVLHAQQRLDRIVVDEAHVPLITDLSWRPVLRKYAQLATFGAPLVMLTATLPVSEEPALLDWMRVNAVPPQVFRCSTVRPNIAYSVLWVEDKWAGPQPEWNEGLWPWSNIASLILAYRQSRMALRNQQHTKTLVFCENKKGILELVEHLPTAVAYFHGQSDAAVSLLAFRSASDGIMCATSAASHGLDEPDIDDVLHVTIPESLEQYLQESGRAARKGQPGSAVLFAGPGIQRLRPKTPEQGRLRHTMDKYLQRRPEPLNATLLICRRRVIDEYMDGDGTRKHCRVEVGELQCDVCIMRQHFLCQWTIDTPGNGHAQVVQEEERGDVERARAMPAQPPSTPPPSYNEASNRHPLGTGATPQLSDEAASPMSSLLASHSSIYRSRADSSSPRVARRGHVSLGSPQLPSMPRPPAPTRATRDRATTFVQWRATWAGMTDAQWANPKTRIEIMAMYWETHCAVHMLQSGDETSWSHTRADCSLQSCTLQKKLSERVAKVNMVYRMPQFSGCYSCKMPQKLCNPKTGLGPCTKRWLHVVMDAWLFCTEFSPTTMPLHQKRLRELGLEQASDKEILDYFGNKIRTRNSQDRDLPSDSVETSQLVEWLVQLTEYGFTRVGKPLLGGFSR